MSLGVLLQLYSCCPAAAHTSACADAAARSSVLVMVLSRACAGAQAHMLYGLRLVVVRGQELVGKCDEAIFVQRTCRLGSKPIVASLQLSCLHTGFLHSVRCRRRLRLDSANTSAAALMLLCESARNCRPGKVMSAAVLLILL